MSEFEVTLDVLSALGSVGAVAGGLRVLTVRMVDCAEVPTPLRAETRNLYSLAALSPVTVYEVVVETSLVTVSQVAPESWLFSIL